MFANKLTVTEIDTDELVPYAGNAKEHPEWQVEQIVKSIQDYGFNDPVGAWHDEDGNPVIVEGHGRLLAAKELGIEKVPVVFLDHMTDEERRAYTIVHNQTTMNTGFDEDILAHELANLGDFNMGDFGLAEGETLEDYDYVDEDSAPDPDFETPATVRIGEVWKLGEHRLMCGDSTKAEDVEKLMDGEKADLLLTDPPYGVSYETEAGKVYNDDLKDQEFLVFLIDAFTASANVARAGCPFYIWHASGPLYKTFANAIDKTPWELHQSIQWVKNSMTLGRSDYQYKNEPCMYGWKPGATHYFAPTRKEVSVIDDEKPIEKMSRAELEAALRSLLEDIEPDVLRYDKPLRSELHPTMKPVKLFAHLIRNSSQKGDIVLDVFAGSGTTIVACEEMGRKAYMMEFDPHYCDVIIERWENLTGQKAEKIE